MGKFLSCARIEFSERHIESVASQDAENSVCVKGGRINRGLEKTPQWRLHNLYYSPNVITIIKFRRTKSAQNVEIIETKMLISLFTYLLTYLLTYSMVQSRSWEANWFEASQEIPRISRNAKVHYRTHKRPPPVSILGQPNPVHIPTPHLLEIHPNIIHPSTPRSPQWSPSLRFPHQDPTQKCYLFFGECMKKVEYLGDLGTIGRTIPKLILTSQARYV